MYFSLILKTDRLLDELLMNEVAGYEFNDDDEDGFRNGTAAGSIRPDDCLLDPISLR
jgi:hypothetical protein